MTDNQDPKDKWRDRFPFGFETFIDALSSRERLAIVSLLMEKNELKLTEICNELEISEYQTRKQIGILSSRAILQTVKIDHDDSNQYPNSTYRLYPFYKFLIRQMIEIFTMAYQLTRNNESMEDIPKKRNTMTDDDIKKFIRNTVKEDIKLLKKTNYAAKKK
jgi:hypothetical protein